MQQLSLFAPAPQAAPLPPLERGDFLLRDYQRETIEKVSDALRRGRDPLFVLATGLGKTEVIIALILEHLARSRHGRILVLADRDHLVDNPHDRFIKRLPELAALVGMVKAERDDCDRQIVFASVQTLAVARRLARLQEHGAIELVITDEAHRSITKQHVDVRAALLEQNPAMRHVGCTATPVRSDGRGLVSAFNEVAIQRDVAWAIAKEHLVKIRLLRVRTAIKFRGIKSSHGDFNKGDLARILDVDNVKELIVATHLKFNDGGARRGITFVPSVAMAKSLAETYRDAGIPAEWASGETPKPERARILERFRAGVTHMLVCYPGLWGEGLDLPQIDIVHQACPTKSASRYLQILGRGLRKTDDGKKEDCIVLDYCPNDSIYTVTGGDVLLGENDADTYREMVKMREEDMADGEEGYVTGLLFDGAMTGLEGDPAMIVAEQSAFVRKTPLTWHRAPGRKMLLGLGPDADGANRTLVIRAHGEHHELLLINQPHYTKKHLRTTVEPIATGGFEELVERAQEVANEIGNAVFFMKNQDWRKRTMSPAQRDMIKWNGGAKLAKEVMGGKDVSQFDCGMASDAITALLALKAIK